MKVKFWGVFSAFRNHFSLQFSCDDDSYIIPAGTLWTVTGIDVENHKLIGACKVPDAEYISNREDFCEHEFNFNDVDILASPKMTFEKIDELKDGIAAATQDFLDKRNSAAQGR